MTVSRRFTFLLAVSALLGVPRLTQAEQLRYKFENGKTQSFAVVQSTDISMTVAGQAIKMKMQQEMTIDQAVTKLDPSGAAHVTQSFRAFRMKSESPVPGAGFEFDAAKELPKTGIAAQIGPLLKTLADSKFMFVLSPNGAVSEFQPPEALLEKVKTAGPVASQLGTQFSKEGLQQLASQGSLEFPTGEMQKGQNWSKKMEMPLPMVGKLKSETKYTYVGPEVVEQKTLQRIDVQTIQNFESEIIKIIDQKSSGKILFDNQLGRVAQSEVSHTTKLEINAMGQKINQDQTMTVVTRPLPNGQK